MPAPRLLVANSIGLTGTEILIAALAGHPAIAMLPGQNFIGFEGCLYRDRSYAQLGPAQVFDSLATEYTMSAGRVWAGMTKNMPDRERLRYDRNRHRELFTKRAPASARSLFDYVAPFAASYFEAMSWSPEGARYAGFFGHNAILSHGPEMAARKDIRVLSWDNRIDLWLANISQRMTWDCRLAAKFWLVNMLHVEAFSADTKRLLRVDFEHFVKDGANALREIAGFLGLEPTFSRKDDAGEFGFLRFQPEIAEGLLRDAALLGRIYGDSAAVQAARSFDQWAPAFIADADNRRLLARYRDFWNSTSHTNFDWHGPIEDEIAARACALAGAPEGTNLSLRFYHEMYALHSLSHATPRALDPRPLGMLENEIVLPLLPYFIKVAVEHLAEHARIAARQAHSYSTLRDNPLYRRLKEPGAQARIKALRLDERLAALESEIAQAESRMRESRVPRND